MPAFDPTFTQPGAVNNVGDDRALFLKVFSGEVITSFTENNVFMDNHRVRTIQSGKSAQFPLIGKTAGEAEYFTRGGVVNPDVIHQAEEIITVDDRLLKAVMIDSMDELLNHIDVRQEYAVQIGSTIARLLDKNVARTGILAARQANKVSGLPGGSTLVNATAKTDASALADSMFLARQTFEEKDVHEAAKAFVKPAQYFLLANGEDRMINSDYSAGGSFSEGVASKVAGLSVVMTNNLPDSNVVGTHNGKYDVDATNTAALIMTNQAVGTVQLQGITSEMGYFMERQGDMLLSKVALGHGVLQPAHAIEVATL